jgi:hypothetical protein
MARQMLTTPVGDAYWAKCFEPEEDRFDEGKPRCWSISWAKDQGDKETLALMQTIEEEFARIHGDGAKPSKNAWPFKEQTDKEGKPTGLMEFRFKKNETTKKGMVLQAPAVYDSHKNLWPAGELIGNGSKVKVAFSAWGWEDKFGKKGVSLSFEALQVLDLVAYERTAPADAFGVENGYVVATPADSFTDSVKEKEEPLTPSQLLQQRAAQVKAEAPAALAQADADDSIPF